VNESYAKGLYNHAVLIPQATAGQGVEFFDAYHRDDRRVAQLPGVQRVDGPDAPVACPRLDFLGAALARRGTCPWLGAVL
jgi:hypothetical protein